jgi:uncharacterized protein
MSADRLAERHSLGFLTSRIRGERRSAMTLTALRNMTRKALAARAKKLQIAGWHQMTKDELVTCLSVRLRRVPGGTSRPRNHAVATTANGHSKTNGRNGADRGKPAQKTIGGSHLNGHRLLKSAVAPTAPGDVRDALVAEAHDPSWIHVRWALSRDTLARAEAALGTQWHHAVPVLRLFDVTNEEGAISSQVRVRDIEIHGDVDHWYLPVQHAPRSYKVQIGYRGAGSLFFMMAQSNKVQTPRPGSHSLKSRETTRQRSSRDAIESTIHFEKIPSYDLRALPTAGIAQGNGTTPKTPSAGVSKEEIVPSPVELRLHAELIVHGSTDPHAELKLLGDRIPVSRDGTFSHRFSLPEGRQVIDAVVTTRNGCHQRTIVLGIERNTKELEPQWFDEIDS